MSPSTSSRTLEAQARSGRDCPLHKRRTLDPEALILACGWPQARRHPLNRGGLPTICFSSTRRHQHRPWGRLAHSRTWVVDQQGAHPARNCAAGHQQVSPPPGTRPPAQSSIPSFEASARWGAAGELQKCFRSAGALEAAITLPGSPRRPAVSCPAGNNLADAIHRPGSPGRTFNCRRLLGGRESQRSMATCRGTKGQQAGLPPIGDFSRVGMGARPIVAASSRWGGTQASGNLRHAS